MSMKITQLTIADSYKALTNTMTELKLPKLKLNRPKDPIMLTRLEEVGILNGQELINKMVESGGMMTGSFPLQCLKDEVYEGSDIDIFFSNQEYDKSKFEQWMYINYGMKSQPATYLIANVISSRKYKITEKATINVVVVKTDSQETLKRYIDRNFDLSFCTTKYDGKEFEVTSLTLQGVGYIQTLGHYKERQPYHHNKVVKKFSHSAHAYYPDIDQILPYRINKYTDRGFKIYCLFELLNTGKVDEEKLLAWTKGVATLASGQSTNEKILKFVDDIELEKCKELPTKQVVDYTNCALSKIPTPPIVASILNVISSVNTLENIWQGLSIEDKQQWLSNKIKELPVKSVDTDKTFFKVEPTDANQPVTSVDVNKSFIKVESIDVKPSLATDTNKVDVSTVSYLNPFTWF